MSQNAPTSQIAGSTAVSRHRSLDKNNRKATIVRPQGPSFLKRLLHYAGRTFREWGYARALYRSRLSGRHIGQLLSSPDDPAPGHAKLGHAIVDGLMLVDGTKVIINDSFWQSLNSKNKTIQNYAHSFHWLQDLAQISDQTSARAKAEFLLSAWMQRPEKWGHHWHKAIWEPEILARRLINWLSHAPLILSKSDTVYRSAILTSIARQTRHLVRTANDSEPGLPRVYTATALIIAGDCLPSGDAWYNQGIKSLEATITYFILADGTPKSRNPADAIRTMQLLVLVRNCHLDTRRDLPPFIQVTLDRIAPFLRAMRHADGGFAQFGGVSAEGGHGTDAILAASEARGRAIENMPMGGYQRLLSEDSLLLIDCGPPAEISLSAKAHASTGSFEFSHGLDRIFIGIGPASKLSKLPRLVGLSRTTAAHCALVIGHHSSNKLLGNGMIGAGTTVCRMRRTIDLDHDHIEIQHDGYKKRYLATVKRGFTLSADGKTLRVTEQVDAMKPSKLVGVPIEVRLHLHPNITPMQTSDNKIILDAKSGDTWVFECVLKTVLEDSLYIPKPINILPTKAIMIQLENIINGSFITEWTLTKITPSPEN